VPDITPKGYLDIKKELSNLELYKYHPNGILNISLNRLVDYLSGKVEIVDPSNPFTYLLETNCLNTAFAIQEHTLLTRKLYPRLANNEKDLYLHMSDYDYLGIFSEPSYGNVIFNILLNDFEAKAYFDPNTKDKIIQIPRHFRINIDGYYFTLPSAIIIRKTENGIIDVKYENQTFNNIFPVETNFINYDVYSVNQSETYITFSVRLPEIDIESTEIPIEKSKAFRNIVTFNANRKFHFFRAFYRLNNQWKEMIVTHTEDVYDINTPTCIINVLQDTHEIEYYIPPVYINTNQIQSKVKFIIYTTNGSINVNFSDYKIDAFTSEYNPVFKEEELNDYTAPLNIISKIVFLKEKIVGGKDRITFNELKQNVINNSIGDRALPITNKQLEFSIKQNNFKLIKEIDVITNRIYLLEAIIPEPRTRYTVPTISLDLLEYSSTINDIKTINNVTDINTNITIINEGTLFELRDDLLYALTPIEESNLKALSNTELVNELNVKRYLYLMYTYILDTTNNKTELRPYDLSSPVIDKINFKVFNVTARVGINTISSNIYKINTGYRIDVLCNFKQYNSLINETNIKPYLVFIDANNSKFFLQGQLYTNINNQPVYRFDLDTNFYIDAENKINITNFRDINNNTSNIFLSLNTKLSLVYLTDIIDPGYTSQNLTYITDGSYLSVSNVVITEEELTVQFGRYLKYLYSQIHTSTGLNEYQTYASDVPLVYDYNVYDANNNIIHYQGETVLDSLGNIVYKYKAGDIKLDSNGNPITIRTSDLVRYLNLLFIDYRIMVATRNDVVTYRNDIKSYITNLVTVDAVKIQDELLENTIAYVTVPKKLGNILVETSNTIKSINSSQSFDVTVYLDKNVYNDIDIRSSIYSTIVFRIEEYLNNNFIIKKTEILDILYNDLKEFIVNISIEKFTNTNEEYIKILNQNTRLSVGKIIQLEIDGYSLLNDINVNFIST